MGITVVVPVFNGGRNAQELADRLYRALREITKDFELILVNDGSRDDSWMEVMNLSQKLDWVMGIDLMKNYGQHNALLCGIRMAKHEFVVTMDDDLQHPPEEIHKLVNRMAEGYDVVYGTIRIPKHSFFRKLGSTGLRMALSIFLGNPLIRKISSFRMFRTRLRESFAHYSGDSVCIDALLSWGTNSIAHVDVSHDSRSNGESNYNFKRLFKHALNNFYSFNAFPLKLVYFLGLFFTVCGMALLMFIIGNYLIHGSVAPGFAFLASTFVIFSGVQLFSLGILGEYISRIHVGIQNRPAYLIRAVSQKKN